MGIDILLGFQNFDFLSIGITIFAIGILGMIVLYNDKYSITNKTFFAFSVLTIIYGIFNYLSYQVTSPVLVLWFLRLTIFFAVWHAFSLQQFFYVFPRKKGEFPKWYKFFLVPVVIITAIITLTPLVFSQIKDVIQVGEVVNPDRGPLIPIFGMVTVGLVAYAIFLLFQKTRKARDVEKSQLELIAVGTIITFSSLISFNFILPVIFNNLSFIPLAPVFIFPFIAFSYYAIIKHHLFDIKVIATELLVFGIWIILIIEAALAESLRNQIIAIITLVFMLFFGVLLIRSVRKEVKQRERQEILTKELQVANDKLKELDDLKTDFISIASHQLRTPLTAIKGYSSMIMEGTYGDSSLQIKGVVDKIFQSAQRLIYIVNDLLDVSRIEQGRFTVAFEETKLTNVLRDVTEELKANAEKKNIALSFEVGVDDAEIKINADFNKIRQVFTNLVDNALKYTNSGYVKVLLKMEDDKALVSVKDSGIGIAASTIPNLFQKFTRAKGVAKLHTDGSGLGLYVAREIVKAHHGEVWAESDGEGKGSQFYVLLPLKNPKAEAVSQFADGM